MLASVRHSDSLLDIISFYFEITKSLTLSHQFQEYKSWKVKSCQKDSLLYASDTD